MIVVGYVLIYLYLIFIITISDILNKKFKVKEIYTRKIIHISVSFCYIFLYVFFGCSIHIIIPPITFIIFNYISYKKNLIKGMENNNNSLGTIFYPISVLLMCIMTYFKNDFYSAFGIGLFIMAFGDGLAPIIGNAIKSKKIFNNKTLSGTVTVFIVSIIVCIVFNVIFNLQFSLLDYLIISFVSTILELIGVNGYDNLSLPLGVSLLTYVLGVI